MIITSHFRGQVRTDRNYILSISEKKNYGLSKVKINTKWFWMKELLHSQASSSLCSLIRNNSTLPYNNNTTYLLPYSQVPYSINSPSHSLPSVRLILYSIGCNCLARPGRATWSKISFARLKSCDPNEIRLSWWNRLSQINRAEESASDILYYFHHILQGGLCKREIHPVP